MANKIKKYSWIHQLNQAALESKLLSEAKIFAKSNLLIEETNFEKSLQAAGGDLEIYRQIRAKKDSKPVDIDGDGDTDAEDVKLDAQDNFIGDDSAIDVSLMSRYPNLQKGMKIGSQEIKSDEAMHKMHNEMDAEIDRIIKTAPPGKRYTIQDLQTIGRILSGR